MAWVAFAELHPEGPVRFDGWDARGFPVGRPVSDPYIPLLAYTQEQVEELAFGALLVVCQEGPDAGLFDVGLERVIRLDARGRADGKCVPLSQSPNARDGARTTFQGFDETHRLVLPSHLHAYETMEANLPKRPLAEPWSLGVTTAGEPGGGSVAELDRDEALAISRGEVDEPELLYFHREASAGHDLSSLAGRVEAVREASGPAVAQWSDLRGIAKQWDRPGADAAYLERVWLNRWVQSERQAFDMARWGELGDGVAPVAGEPVVAGFDGSRWRDVTSLVVVSLRSGTAVRYASWEPDGPDAEVPVAEVDPVVDEVFSRFRCARLYGDPAFGWDECLARWAGRHGTRRVLAFYTDSRGLRRTAFACRGLAEAIRGGEVRHVGDAELTRHVAAAQKRNVRMVDDEGRPLWTITKERSDSPAKIDHAMALVLSWQARVDALRAGEVQQGRRFGSAQILA
jgi:hypothetical protein